MKEILPENFRFRTVTNRDIPEIVALVKKFLEEFDLIYSPGSSESDLHDIEATYLHNGGAFEIIQTKDAKIIGFIALLRINPTTAKLRKMYVAKDYRGLGLGRLLLGKIINKAIYLGYHEILLETVQTMQAAIHLYESFGFRRVNQAIAISPRCNIVMKKSILQ